MVEGASDLHCGQDEGSNVEMVRTCENEVQRCASEEA